MQIRQVLSAGVFALIAAGCGPASSVTDAQLPASVASVLVAPASSRFLVGQQDSLTVQLLDSVGAVLPTRPISWSIANSAVATVTGSGVVTAVAAGSTTVSATLQGKSGTASITVIPPPTLVVTNTTCNGTVCDSLSVLGFPDNQPRTPGGLWRLVLGTSTKRELCIALPTAANFYIYAVGGDTTTVRWTATLPIAIGTLAPSSQFALQAAPSTGNFIPVDAPGWSIMLPGGSAPVPAPPCTP